VKVLYVLPFAQPGGAESMVLRLLRSLAGSVEASAVLLDDGQFAQTLRGEGVAVDVVAMPGKQGVLRFPGAARAAARRHGDVDLIHANGTKGALFGILLARRLGVPLVWLKPDHFFDGRVARAIARRCDHVVCVSEAMAAQFGPALADRVSVAYPGVTLPERAAPIGDEPLIVCAGRLDPLKGFDDLIRAVAVLRDRGIEARLRICGPTDRMHAGYERELRDLIAGLGLEQRAEVLGWVEDYDELINAGRLLATASKPPAPGKPSEAAPTVLMDAMARGRPVVAQREAGTAEVVGDAGTLVDAPTPERLADALAPYLTDAALAAEVGQRGRGRVERLFDQRITAERFGAVYARVSA
jgi:glycosyltransferase involved in cell wall biosynthesis